MPYLAIAAEALSWFLRLALPVLVGLHLIALLAYAGLTRDWQVLKALLPRNLMILAFMGVLAFGMGPLHRRALHWRYADAYLTVQQAEAALYGGHYVDAYRLRASLTEASPPRNDLDRDLALAAPHVLTHAISLANGGDYAAATALLTAMPESTDPSAMKKRNKVIALWAPFVKLQQAHAANHKRLAAANLRLALAPFIASYDALSKATMSSALRLDPTASEHIEGHSVHPMAAQLLAASVKAHGLENELDRLPASDKAVAALRDELKLAVTSFKHGCEESMAYANSADEGPQRRAQEAFERARHHRDQVEELSTGLAPKPVVDAPASNVSDVDELDGPQSINETSSPT